MTVRYPNRRVSTASARRPASVVLEAGGVSETGIQTTPLCFDDDGLPVGYEAQQLFGLEAAYLGGRF
jgi:hypothetical protein